MPDDLSHAMPLDAPYPDAADPQTPPEPEPVEAADDDAEPDGVIVQGNQRLVDVSVLAAERKRVRTATEKQIREKELAPLQQQAQQASALREALNAAQPYVDFLKSRPDLIQQQPPSAEEQVTDDEAAQEARDLQLYNAQSQLDIPTAKKIIARRRTETYQAAQYASQQAVAPMQAQSAKQASDMNFVRMVQQVDSNGQPLVDPQVLAEEWVALGPEMTQHAQVAEVVLERAMGKMLRQGRRPAPLSRGPVYSEVPGGPRQTVTQLTALDRKLGLTQQDLKESAGKFVPGGMSVIGE